MRPGEIIRAIASMTECDRAEVIADLLGTEKDLRIAVDGYADRVYGNERGSTTVTFRDTSGEVTGYVRVTCAFA